jgi:3-carboxy-cis,cis-muconate cycloisomerase
VVSAACREALAKKTTLFAILDKLPAVKAALDSAALKKLCDPANYLGAAAVMTDRVLARRKR